MSQKVVVYYRVSTQKQGRSGLGLDAQEALFRSWVGDRQVVGEYMEIESGTKVNRVELRRALDHARKEGAILAVAKLDRLARNVAFISAILETDVEIVACDNPHASRMMLQLLAVFAEYESKCISDRTKAALAAAKARGVKLGCRRGSKDDKFRKGSGWRFTFEQRSRGGKKGGLKNRGKYKWKDAEGVAMVKQLKREGLTFPQIIARLEAAGMGTFTKSYLSRVCARPDPEPPRDEQPSRLVQIGLNAVAELASREGGT